MQKVMEKQRRGFCSSSYRCHRHRRLLRLVALNLCRRSNNKWHRPHRIPSPLAARTFHCLALYFSAPIIVEPRQAIGLFPIPEDAPAARPAEPVAVFTDDDLFDEPDWVPPIHVQIPADWPPLPDTSSSSGSSYVYPDGSTTDEGTLPRSFSHNTSSLQGTLPNYTPPSTLSTSHHSSVPATNTDQDTLNHP